MSNLFGSISIALRALLAQQGALEVTSNNIANINTPGFSRQRPVLQETDPIVDGRLTWGNGVDLQRIESLRDRILELRIQEATQQKGDREAYLNPMQTVEGLMGTGTGSLGDSINQFFSSLQQLQTDPRSASLRQGVLTAAGNLGNAFHDLASGLTQLRTNVDLDVSQSVTEVNRLTAQIAGLNGQVEGVEKLGQDAGALADQRNQLIQQLSELVDVSEIDTGGGISLTTSNGTALVAGNRAFSLETHVDPSGMTHLYAQGGDITSTISGGKLGGLIRARDVTVPGLQNDLDGFATQLVSALNTAHHAGYDLSGTPGGDLFVPLAAGGGGAAAVAVAVKDPAQLAASSDQSPGSNGNLAGLLAVSSQPLPSGLKPTDVYASLVYRVGSEVSNTQAEQDAGDMVLQQLENQRAALSGVSLDEEAANLLRYQRAYEAAARVVSVVDELTQVAINMGAGT